MIDDDDGSPPVLLRQMNIVGTASAVNATLGRLGRAPDTNSIDLIAAKSYASAEGPGIVVSRAIAESESW